MEPLKSILILIAAVCFILIWFFEVCNKFNFFMIRINEIQSKIEASLRKRYDLLSKAIPLVSACENAPENILSEIVEIKSKKLNNFDFDKQISLGITEFYSYGKTTVNLKNNVEYQKIAREIEKSEIELSAYKKYYNEIAKTYNKNTKKITKYLIAKIAKFKQVSYFE